VCVHLFFAIFKIQKRGCAKEKNGISGSHQITIIFNKKDQPNFFNFFCIAHPVKIVFNAIRIE